MQPDIQDFLHQQLRPRVAVAAKTEGGIGLLELETILSLYNDKRYYAFRSSDEVALFWKELRTHDEDDTAVDLLMDTANALYLYLGADDDEWMRFLKGIARGVCAGRTSVGKVKTEYRQSDTDFNTHVMQVADWEAVILANPWIAIAILYQLSQLNVVDIAEEIRTTRIVYPRSLAHGQGT